MFWRHTPLDRSDAPTSYRAFCHNFSNPSFHPASHRFWWVKLSTVAILAGVVGPLAFAQKPMGLTAGTTKNKVQSVRSTIGQGMESGARSDIWPASPTGTIKLTHNYAWEEHAPNVRPDSLGGYGMLNLFDSAAPHGQTVVQLVRGDSRRKEVALTFDDGPHPPFTYKLLDLLKALNVKATFFVVGFKVEDDPEVLQRMVAEGHEVANHSYHHPNLKLLPPGLIESEIRLNNDAIRRACGKEPVCFRPPGGQRSDDVLEIAHKLGMSTILWTDDPADYANPGAEVIEQKLLSHVKPGATILLHDGVEQTYQMLPNFVARLRQQGYRFVTVSEMLQHLEATRPRMASTK